MIYIESDLYKKDYEKIFLKDGYKIASLYDYVAKNLKGENTQWKKLLELCIALLTFLTGLL